ncbi:MULTISPECIES: hypothetical protein [unclassified Pseudomonas]|uniref:hypothetical protein n=1 Tax=unclassified Pseudomonas TaxID=196821 RepID=UPI00111BF969|nr:MULTISPECIES: hypothetical protein [unclassified Pseudomonas]
MNGLVPRQQRRKVSFLSVLGNERKAKECIAEKPGLAPGFLECLPCANRNTNADMSAIHQGSEQ